MKKKVNQILMFIVLCSFTIVMAIVLLMLQLNLRGQATAPFESVICTDKTCAEPVTLSCDITNIEVVNGCGFHE